MSTGIESALDHPLLGARYSNNGADAFGPDGIVELYIGQLLDQSVRYLKAQNLALLKD